MMNRIIASLAGLVACMALFPFAGLAAPIDTKSLGYLGGGNDHPHNLSSLNTDGSGIHATVGENEDRICVFCHTPHGASPKGALWNRVEPLGPSGDGSFPLYGEDSLRQDEVQIDNIAAAQYGPIYGDYPNGASRLCMSCHDGVTAIGEVINGGTLASLTMSSAGTIDLDRSHPISFVYTDSVRVDIMAGQAGAAGQYTLPSAGFLDAQNRVQCTTCHDPHVNTNNGSTYLLPMWRNYVGADENADYEATCGECHVDGGSGSSNSPGLDNPGESSLHNI